MGAAYEGWPGGGQCMLWGLRGLVRGAVTGAVVVENRRKKRKEKKKRKREKKREKKNKSLADFCRYIDGSVTNRLSYSFD